MVQKVIIVRPIAIVTGKFVIGIFVVHSPKIVRQNDELTAKFANLFVVRDDTLESAVVFVGTKGPSTARGHRVEHHRRVHT